MPIVRLIAKAMNSGSRRALSIPAEQACVIVIKAAEDRGFEVVRVLGDLSPDFVGTFIP
jgi:hypothetical protein